MQNVNMAEQSCIISNFFDDKVLSQNGGELLTITGAAVDALGYGNTGRELLKPKRTIHSPNSSGNINPSDLAFARSFSHPVQSSINESGEHDPNQTGISQSSLENSSLLKGTATKVKISARKLKQIQSPFELTSEFKKGNNKYLVNTNDNPNKTTYKTSGVIVEKHLNVKNGTQGLQKRQQNRFSGTDKSLGQTNGLLGTVTDSGYDTHNVQVIHEIQGEQFSQDTSKEEMQSLEEDPCEKISEEAVRQGNFYGCFEISLKEQAL